MKCVFVSKDNSWSNRLYKELKEDNSIQWTRISKNVYDKIHEIDPDWVFFFHWSHIVPREVYEKNKCVVIHTSNLPDGKGGSPLQNQIIDGIIKSKVNLISMVEQLDAGPVYCSQDITLQGSLFDIWMCISTVAHALIKKCIKDNLSPIQQTGHGKQYKRRKDNSLPIDTEELYDIYRHVQMLDAEGYPNSNLKVGNFIFSFSRAKHCGEEILCDVKIRKSK